jgi:hypothetical protein
MMLCVCSDERVSKREEQRREGRGGTDSVIIMSTARKEFEVVWRVILIEEMDTEEKEARGMLVAPYDVFSSIAYR